MKVVVEVKTRAARPRVEKVDDGLLKVWVSAVPEKGKANVEVVKVVADYFGVAKSRVRIVLGKTAREKVVEITE